MEQNSLMNLLIALARANSISPQTLSEMINDFKLNQEYFDTLLIYDYYSNQKNLRFN